MSTSYSAIAFRQIACSYNAINALPAEAAQQVGAAFARLTPGERILDLLRISAVLATTMIGLYPFFGPLQPAFGRLTDTIHNGKGGQVIPNSGDHLRLGGGLGAASRPQNFFLCCARRHSRRAQHKL